MPFAKLLSKCLQVGQLFFFRLGGGGGGQF